MQVLLIRPSHSSPRSRLLFPSQPHTSSQSRLLFISLPTSLLSASPLLISLLPSLLSVQPSPISLPTSLLSPQPSIISSSLPSSQHSRLLFPPPICPLSTTVFYFPPISLLSIFFHLFKKVFNINEIYFQNTMC